MVSNQEKHKNVENTSVSVVVPCGGNEYSDETGKTRGYRDFNKLMFCFSSLVHFIDSFYALYIFYKYVFVFNSNKILISYPVAHYWATYTTATICYSHFISMIRKRDKTSQKLIHSLI